MTEDEQVVPPELVPQPDETTDEEREARTRELVEAENKNAPEVTKEEV